MTPSLDYAPEKESLQYPLQGWLPGGRGQEGWAGPVALAWHGCRLPHPLIGGQACAPVLSLSQLKNQMVPGGGQGSKGLMPEPQPLWFVYVLEREINTVENPRSHSLNDDKPRAL